MVQLVVGRCQGRAYDTHYLVADHSLTAAMDFLTPDVSAKHLGPVCMHEEPC